jgi:predicted enzyme related to lactoylglutathione lyase
MSKTPESSAAWFEIGVKSLDKAAAFYSAVLGAPLKREEMGPQPVAVFPYDGGMSGNLYETVAPGETGAASPVIHLNVAAPLEAALERVKKAGGQAFDIVTIPPGRFAYCKDPDGTRFGLFTRA